MSTTPMPARFTDTGSAERWAWAGASVLLAVFLTCLRMTTTRPYKLATFEQLVAFEAVEPFQHRALLPAIAAAGKAVLPVGETLLFAAMEVGLWVALIVLAYRALLFFSIAGNDITRRALAFTIVIPMALHLIVPDLQITQSLASDNSLFDLGDWQPRAIYYYVYDLPAAVFTLALVLMLSRLASEPRLGRAAACLAVFAIATANRETTVFLLPFAALLLWSRWPHGRWFVFMAALSAVFLAVQGPLQLLFADNVNPNAHLRGTNYEYHLIYNLAALASPLYTLTFAARFAAGLYLPILVWRRLLDARLALALVGFALPMALFAAVVGRIVEQRIFVEIVPLIWLAALQVIAARTIDRDTDCDTDHGTPTTPERVTER